MNNILAFLACHKRGQNKYLSEISVELIKSICLYALTPIKYQIDLRNIIKKYGHIVKIYCKDLENIIMVTQKNAMPGYCMNISKILILNITNKKINAKFDTENTFYGDQWIITENNVYCFSRIEYLLEEKEECYIIIYHINENQFIKYKSSLPINFADTDINVPILIEVNGSVYVETHDETLGNTTYSVLLRKITISDKINFDLMNKNQTCEILKLRDDLYGNLYGEDLKKYLTRETYVGLDELIIVNGKYRNLHNKIVYYDKSSIGVLYHQFVY